MNNLILVSFTTQTIDRISLLPSLYAFAYGYSINAYSDGYLDDGYIDGRLTSALVPIIYYIQVHHKHDI